MLAFDIETVPQPSALDAPYTPDDHTPPSNYKNADAIERWHVTNEAKWREARVKECSLSPRLGQIVAISYASDNGHRNVDTTRFATETMVLYEFWEALANYGEIASWNGKGFDLPFIIARSAILGVKPLVWVPKYLARYQHTPHFDVKLALEATRPGDTLDAWASAFGAPAKLGNGSEVYGMVQRGEWDKLREYAQRDADTTLELAVRCAPFFGVECAPMVPVLA